jgi:hypothetical protein
MNNIEHYTNGVPDLKTRYWPEIIMDGIVMAKRANLEPVKLIIPYYIQKAIFDVMENDKENQREFSPLENFRGIPVEFGEKLDIVVRLWR